MFEEIEPAGRIRHARRCEVVVNGCRAGSRLADEVLRDEVDPDVVGARSRRVEPHLHRIAALAARPFTATQLESNTLLPFPMAAKKVLKLPLVIV